MNTSRARHWRQSYAPVETQSTQQPQVKVKVKKRRWLTKGEKIIYSMLSICLIVACYFIISYASSIDTLNRDIQTLEETINDQRVQNENLQFEIKELSKPERILEIAEKHGLKIHDTKVKRAQIMDN